MVTKTYFSNRIYKNGLSKEYVDEIAHALLVFNRAKQFSFSTSVKEKRSEKNRRNKSMHLTVKECFRLDDYYANSAVQEANALQKSLTELNKMYITNKAEQIKSVNNKIKNTKSKLTTLTKMKESFVNGKPKLPKNSNIKNVGNLFVVEFKKQTNIFYHAYQFEHSYLDVEIKRLKSRVGFLTFKQNRFEDELKGLKIKVSSVVFGSKKLFKSQYTKEEYKSKHAEWVKKWGQSRYNQMVISGRKDSGSGNFVFRYDTNENTLSFHTPSGVKIEISNLTFPFGQDKVVSAIEKQINCKNKKKFGRPIGWSLEDHGEYYIFKCIVNEEENQYVNFSKSDGIIGIDCNVAHFAVSNINRKGQLISSHTLDFDIWNKSSNQINKIIEVEAIELVNIAVREDKPIAIEKLDTTTSKVSNRYGNKKANFKMSMFAYNKMISAIKSRAEKMGVAIFEVNPAYTSQIGKMKYMKRFGISIHEAASFVIARRAMGFKEKLPPVLGVLLPEKITDAHHWVQWKYVSKMLKGIRTHSFYLSDLFDLDKFHLTGEFFLPGSLSDLEAKSLPKLKSGKTIS
jgi:IS605 OrfB family transposase